MTAAVEEERPSRADSAEIRLSGAARQEVGRVLRVERRAVWVETDLGEVDARLAASCLLAPEPDDVVLLALGSGGGGWVLAVLERRSEVPARVRLEGAEVRLEAPDGRLSLASPHGVDVVSGGAVRLVGDEVDVVARESHLKIERIVAEGRALLARLDVGDVAVGLLETASERLTQRLGRAYRFVEDQEVVRAGTIDQRASESLVLRAKDALLNARRLVRLDGEQIHLG